jgi:hypothetical protein
MKRARRDAGAAGQDRRVVSLKVSREPNMTSDPKRPGNSGRTAAGVEWWSVILVLRTRSHVGGSRKPIRVARTNKWASDLVTGGKQVAGVGSHANKSLGRD